MSVDLIDAYPRCSKRRKVIKFDVPRISWGTTCIEVPLIPDKGEVKDMLDQHIDELRSIKAATAEDFDEAIAMIEANLGVAQRFNNAEAAEDLEDQLAETVELREQTLQTIDVQIQTLLDEKAKV